jgi:hypothetical protein
MATVPSGAIRPGKGGHSGPLTGYEATDGGPVAGWMKVDDVAGEIDASGVGHGHFADKATGDGSGGTTAGPWKQT